MQPRIVITGLGVVSPAGVGSGALFEALVSGRTLVSTLDKPWAEPPYQYGCPVRDTGARDRIPAARLRRMGRLSQMTVVAAREALAQADGTATSAPGDLADTGVVLGTGFGALDETVAFIGELLSQGPGGANPALFPASVMNIAAAQTAMELGLQGFNTTVNHKEISTEMAVQLAADALRLGHVGRVLVGGVDELSQPLHHGYRRLGGLGRGLPQPYRAARDGICLGEGAAVVVLELRDRARARGVTVLAEMAGIGAAGGPRPLVGWGPAWEGGHPIGPSLEAGVTAIRAALDEAKVSAAQLSLVIGCGCGSRDLDRLDAEVLRKGLDGQSAPVTSPHGALGTFAAAGALRLASAIEALRRGWIYPTLGEGALDPQATPGRLMQRSCQQELRSVLLASHASGGGSAALVVQRGDV